MIWLCAGICCSTLNRGSGASSAAERDSSTTESAISISDNHSLCHRCEKPRSVILLL